MSFSVAPFDEYHCIKGSSPFPALTRLGPNYLLCLLQSLSPEGLEDKREARELKKREKRKTRMTETSAEREPTVMSKKKERTKNVIACDWRGWGSYFPKAFVTLDNREIVTAKSNYFCNNDFWDRFRGRADQLLAIFSQKSLRKLPWPRILFS